MYDDLLRHTKKAGTQLCELAYRSKFANLFEHKAVSREQIAKVKDMSWQQIAEALYMILDDVDTLSDVCKENLQAFQTMVLKKQREKNDYMYSPDGRELKRVNENWGVGDKFTLGGSKYEIVKIKDFGRVLSSKNLDTDEVKDIPLTKAISSGEEVKESNLGDHAKRELELAGMFDKEVEGSEAAGEWNNLTAKAVIELMELFGNQGHSGFSAEMTRELFNRLSNWEVLTELTNNSEEWNDVSEMSGGHSMWQSTRTPASFSTDGGKTYYNLDIAVKEGDKVHPNTKDLKLFVSKVYEKDVS